MRRRAQVLHVDLVPLWLTGISTKIALALSKRKPGEKHHPGVYEVLRHETGATTYKSIPPAGYQAAIEFLDNWLAAIQQADDE